MNNMSSLFKKSKKLLYQEIDDLLRKFHMEAYLLIFVEVVVGAIVSTVSFLLFVKFAREVLEKEGVHVDTVISQAIYSLRTPYLTDVMRAVSFVGGELFFVVTFIIILGLFIKQHKRATVLFACATLGGQFLNLLIKFLLKVPRPTLDPIALASFYSFPSGHAMNSFIFFASLTYLVFHFTRKKRLSFFVVCISAFLVLLIGFSRVYLGVHNPTDIIAGYIAGFWWFITVILLDKTFHFYRLFKETRHS